MKQLASRGSVLSLLALVSVCATVAATSKFRLAFGSCFFHKVIYLDSHIFSELAKFKPDAFVWLGDATYTDTYENLKYHLEEDIETVWKNFDDVKKNPDYQRLLKSTKKVYGTWDDHDFGLDNAGKDNPRKEVMRKLFLNFLDEPADSIRRYREDGIYQSYYLDSEKKIKLILLDNRFSKDEERDLANIPFEEQSSLGEEQEEWLRQEILTSTAHFTLIAAGIQVLPDDRDQEHFFHRSREVVARTSNPNTNVIILSGDVHYAEILRDECSAHIHGYPLKEWTSSGLSHSDGEYPYIGSLPFHLGLYLAPPTFSTDRDRYSNRNAAIIDFTLGSSPRDSVAELTVIGREGQKVLSDRLDHSYFRQRNAQPDLSGYLECVAHRKERYSKAELILLRLFDYSHPFTIGIYGLLLALFMLLKALLSKACRSQKHRPKTD